jgi:hypothetical protein
MTDTPSDGFRDRPAWLFAVAGLLLAQAGLALALFGPSRSWAAVTDDRPILSGRHPLHLYHGTLGAAAFRARGTTSCYDPRFQAGLPKTPVFDAGCRPAELFLVLNGGGYSPAAYKVGLFALLLLVPLAFTAAARGAGLPAGAAVLAGVGGILLTWSPPGWRMIADGQIDSFAAGLAGVVFVPWLARFARTLGVDAWLVLAGTALVGWFAHPFLWVGLTPVVFVYYLVFAPRHGPAFHLGLAGVTFIGITPNVWWIVDWAKFWWLRRPTAEDQFRISDWQAVLGSGSDYPALFGSVPGGVGFVVAGMLGAALVWRAGCRASAWLLALSAALAVAAARVAAAWEGLPAHVPGRLALLAAGFLVPPLAFGVWSLLDRFRLAGAAAAALVAGAVAVGWCDGRNRPLAHAVGIPFEPLAVGLGPEQRELLAVLKQHTTPDARILWDETTDERPGWNWSALLPLLADRSFLGGLDHDAGMDHSYCAMCDCRLTGRCLGEWSGEELAAFCRWYNVGWVVARSPGVIERWAKYPGAREVARLSERGRLVVLYAVDRPRSFVLSGTATWEAGDSQRVALTNVVPNAEGEVQLSLHMIEGMRVFPSYVQIQPLQDPTGRDPVHLIRLKVPGPVPRLTLMWDAP